jgi:molecular chaperone GrpE
MTTTGNASETGDGRGGAAEQAVSEQAVSEQEVSGQEAAVPDTSEATESALESALAEVEDRWRRAVADLDNLRKRYARELQREREAERARVASAWLPVLDNLELALGHADSDQSPIAQGIRAIRDQAVEALARLGYPRRDEVGVPFDPSLHEVVTVVDEPEAPPGTVVRVVRPGYGEHDRQLRPMAVAVSKPQE